MPELDPGIGMRRAKTAPWMAAADGRVMPGHDAAGEWVTTFGRSYNQRIVVPAKAGTHLATSRAADWWVPAFPGTTAFSICIAREAASFAFVIAGEATQSRGSSRQQRCPP